MIGQINSEKRLKKYNKEQKKRKLYKELYDLIDFFKQETSIELTFEILGIGDFFAFNSNYNGYFYYIPNFYYYEDEKKFRFSKYESEKGLKGSFTLDQIKEVLPKIYNLAKNLIKKYKNEPFPNGKATRKKYRELGILCQEKQLYKLIELLGT